MHLESAIVQVKFMGHFPLHFQIQNNILLLSATFEIHNTVRPFAKWGHI